MNSNDEARVANVERWQTAAKYERKIRYWKMESFHYAEWLLVTGLRADNRKCGRQDWKDGYSVRTNFQRVITFSCSPSKSYIILKR